MLKIDLHLHTVMSGHAYNTILEYINRAKEMKMKIIGKDTISNLKAVVDTVRANKKKVIVSSDGHNIWEMADDRPLEAIKTDIGLTDDLVINNYPGELMGFFGGGLI